MSYTIKWSNLVRILSGKCFMKIWTRSNTWTAVLDALPNAMAADISRKSWHAVLHLILSGFGDQYISELHVSYIQCIKRDTKCTEIFKNCDMYISQECNSGRVLCMNSCWLARIFRSAFWLAGGTAANQSGAGLRDPCWRAGMGFGMAISWWPSQLNLYTINIVRNCDHNVLLCGTCVYMCI